MFSRMAKTISHFLCGKGVIPQEDLAMYAYSFEVFLSMVCNTLLLLVGALLTHTFWQSLCFAASFFALRRVCGGLHAKTHFWCITTMMAIYVLYLVLLAVTPEWALWCYLAGEAAACLITALLAPVEDRNKPLSPRERMIYGRQSKALCGVLLAVSLLCYGLGRPDLGASFAMAQVMVAGLLAAAYLRDKRRRIEA